MIYFELDRPSYLPIYSHTCHHLYITILFDVDVNQYPLPNLT